MTGSAARTEPFFRKVDWRAFWVAFLATLVAYFHTMAPTVTLEDSGELAVGSDYLGVPHPPGYPIWTLLTWLFQWVFHWVKYYGTPDSNWEILWKSVLRLFGRYDGVAHPNPAWSVGFCSAFFGALACGMQAMLVCRAGLDMLRGFKRATEVLGEKQENFICFAGGIASGLLLAFSPVLWSQSTIVEVYALNAAFQIGCLVLLYRWMGRPQETSTLLIMWFVFGLGLTNHQTLLFLGPALAVGILVRDLKLFSAYGVVGVGVGAIVLINSAIGHQAKAIAKAGATPQLAAVQAWLWNTGPANHGFWIWTTLALAIPLLAVLMMPKHGRTVGFSVLLAFAGLAFNGFMPFASEQNPPINWGYPRTWEGFMHAITRGQYEAINMADIFGSRFLSQVGMYLMDVRGQFTLPIAVLACLPFCIWGLNVGGRRWNAIVPASVLTLSTIVLGLVESVSASRGHDLGALGDMYRVLGMLVFPIAAFGFMLKIVNYYRSLWAEMQESDWLETVLGWGIIGLSGLGILYADAQWLMHLIQEDMPFAARIIILGLILGPPVAAGLILWLEQKPYDLGSEISEQLQRALLMTVVAFLSLSVVFITFQNLEMDIQTLFIGRVQFIQSHAVFSLWLGFGLIFLLTQIDTWLRGRKLVTYGTAVLAMVGMPGVLVYENYRDEDQIKIVGGAEMNGHDFGWQFGAWGMEGAREILRALPENERAAYPDPTYPPPMGTNAVFFGGTDPGRFVPTYMIYGGHFRPDIYLITQNALADNTYMNVMRDLYGDLIYIPSQQDSNMAFQQYVEDVRSGKTAAGADVSFEGGRVQVQGVGGVMQINGILARMIFDVNKRSHDFYVEESYVIPWMYPYLEPHGLFMKLNADPLPGLSEDVVKKDRAFWDWYTKRLIGTATNLPSDLRSPPGAAYGTYELASINTNGTKTWRVDMNPKFKVDVVARKTFSKLRSAIAGLYIARRNFAEGEYAFKQAIDLYPLSPEANFRLADAYMQQFRFLEARKIIEDFLREDPLNTKVEAFLGQIKQLEAANTRREELEKALTTGGDINLAFELLSIYRGMGLMPRFDSLADSIANQPNIPPQFLQQLANQYLELKRLDMVVRMLQRYLQRNPGDAGSRVKLAAILTMMQQVPAAMAEIRIAVQQGGEPVRDLIRRDPAFDSLRSNGEFQRLVPNAGGPGLPLGGNLPMF